MDFFRLVLAVVDDHARAQGQDNASAAAAAAAAAVMGRCVYGSSDADGSRGASSVGEGDGSLVDEEGATGLLPCSAACLFGVDDLPRLYHRPGVIIRKLFRACMGDEASGEVRGSPWTRT